MKRIIGGAAVAIGVAVFGGAGAFDDETDRNDSGEIVESGALGVYSIRVGDCMMLPDAVEVTSLEAVPCSEPHNAQAYASFDVNLGSEWPGMEAISEAGAIGCLDEFEGFVGIPFETSIYGADFFSPLEAGWTGDNDREITCLLLPPPGQTTMTGDKQQSAT